MKWEKNYYYLLVDNKLQEIKNTKNLENILKAQHKLAKKVLRNSSNDIGTKYVALLNTFDR